MLVPWRATDIAFAAVRHRSEKSTTATRTSEVTGACWDEFDLDAAVWVIPQARMKMKKEHRVPLSAPALDVVRGLVKDRSSDHVFPSQKPGSHLSNMAMLQLIRGMGHDFATHGFRSSFRDWVAETTSFPAEVAEMALAHVVKDSVERAYRRGDLFAKRRDLMDAWAAFCEGGG